MITAAAQRRGLLLGLVAVVQPGNLGLPALLSPVPEARTWLLFSLGLAGLAWVRRRGRLQGIAPAQA